MVSGRHTNATNAYLEVVGVLPDVDAEEGHEAGGGLQGVLVGGRGDGQAVVHLVVSEPAPARSLHGHGGGGDGVLQVVQAAVLGVDGLEQLRIAEHAAALASGGEVLPKDGVVQVTTA